MKALMASSVALGIVLCIIGAEMNGAAATQGGGGTPGAGVATVGGVLIAIPALSALFFLCRALLRTAAAETRRYAAWRKTLTPEQLKAAQLAEFAALMAVHEVLKPGEKAKARQQHHIDQIMHGGF